MQIHIVGEGEGEGVTDEDNAVMPIWPTISPTSEPSNDSRDDEGEDEGAAQTTAAIQLATPTPAETSMSLDADEVDVESGALRNFSLGASYIVALVVVAFFQ